MVPTIPADCLEIARMVTIRGRVLLVAYQDVVRGTFGYWADGAGGYGHTLATILQRMRDVREWPGGKTAQIRATSFFSSPLDL